MKKQNPGPKKGQKRNQIKRSEFGARLVKTRNARGLTQEELGEKAGVTKRVIAFYEGDNQSPPIDLVTQIATALNVTVSYLAGESPQKLIKEDIKPAQKKVLGKINNLPKKDLKTIIEMIDALTAKNTLENL